MKSLYHIFNKTNLIRADKFKFEYSRLHFYTSQLIIVGSRPGMGKTGFLLFLMQKFMMHPNKGLLFISNEYDENTLYRRFVSQILKTSFEKLDDCLVELVDKHEDLKREDVFITHSTVSWEKLKPKIKKQIKENNISAVFIDKIQGLYSEQKFERRSEEIEFILHEMKNLSVEKNIIIVASSSLNRKVDHREGKRPCLADLRSSGAIEEVGDIILFVHRPEYYRITEDDSGNSLIGIAEIIVAKNRMGKIHDFTLRFDNNIPSFFE